MGKATCREAFTDELLRLARQDSTLWMVATDSRGSVTSGHFFETLPKQAVEMGIAEQNGISVAAGLALTGKNVFVCGPACFLSGRAFEQIKIDVAYNETNVKIVGVSAGVSYGPLGTTHTCLHDFAGMRSLPQIEIFAPADDMQTRFVTNYLAAKRGPAYIRMGRGAVENIYQSSDTFDIGKAKCLRKGSDIAIIACGEMVYPTLCAAEMLLHEGVSATVLDVFSLRPFDETAVVAAAQRTGAVLTVEEHSIFGGLGEQVSHVLAESCPTRMRILGFPDEQYRVGKPDDLFAAYGLNAIGIANAARRLIGG